MNYQQNSNLPTKTLLSTRQLLLEQKENKINLLYSIAVLLQMVVQRSLRV